MADSYDPAISVTGTGETLVLVPGMDGTGLLFYRQVPLLARTYRVVTYALRHTASRMQDLVDDLSQVIAAASPDRRAIVIGESFGGALAMSFALQRPEQVIALVVLNSFPFFAPQRRLRAAALSLSAMPWGAMRLVRRLTAWRLHSPHTSRDEIERFLALTAQASRLGYINRLRILMEYDIRNRLPDMRPPTLFLASECDHLVPSVVEARAMERLTPGSSLRILAGHGHICLIAPHVDLERLLADWRGTSTKRPE
jgi:pimeloyl-ACP methyl ester carboxylesterase